MDQQTPGQQPESSHRGNKKGLWTSIAIIAAIIILGGLALANSRQKSLEQTQPSAENKEQQEAKFDADSDHDGMDEAKPSMAADSSASPATKMMTDKNSTKVFYVNGKNFSFNPAEIKVSKGDKVKIVFKNESGFHDWVLDEFNVRTPQISTGESAEVEFTADKAGTFEYYCSVGNHRQMGMKGNLIVE